MKSHLNDNFISCFQKLPNQIKHLARKKYKLWKKNPRHPSLHFKQVGKRRKVYSIRIGIGWRALGLKKNETIIWFWIGSHEDYEKILSSKEL